MVREHFRIFDKTRHIFITDLHAPKLIRDLHDERGQANAHFHQLEYIRTFVSVYKQRVRTDQWVNAIERLLVDREASCW